MTPKSTQLLFCPAKGRTANGCSPLHRLLVRIFSREAAAQHERPNNYAEQFSARQCSFFAVKLSCPNEKQNAGGDHRQKNHCPFSVKAVASTEKNSMIYYLLDYNIFPLVFQGTIANFI